MGCYKRCYLKEWARDTADIHGLKHIAGDGGNIRRLIWTIATLGAFGYFLYLAILSLISFAESNHVTKTDVESKSEISFPAFTVCNFNKYREAAITEHDIKNVGTHLGIIDEDHNLLNPHLYNDEFKNRLAAVDWSSLDIDDDYDMTDFTNRTGHQLEDMIVECYWQGQNCTADDFHHVFSHLGNCYTFNHVDLNMTTHSTISAGAANGLKITLNIEENEYTPTNDLDGAAEDAGIKWMLHHPTVPPYVKELGHGAGPGHHTFVAVRHETITSLPSPYTTCVEDTSGKLSYYEHYSIQACRIECETELVYAECGCKLVEQPGPYPVCNPAESHECGHVVLVQAVTGDIENLCDCESPCNVENYPFTATNVKLRAKYMQQIYSETEHNFTADYIEDNLVLLSVYYEALNSEVVEQLPEMTVPSLLATLGGNFGLFLGASVLTILQLLEYIFDEVTATCSCKSSPTNRVGSSRAKPAVKDEVTKTTDDDISIIDIKKDSWNENYTER
ncbi:acid-sensing ion channel 1C-like isoform X1 [Asterias amurensis]|uniref:acid-sensing ion channel 1C-like isoform X1 n=1 Tax=Asterias amurensis TaxID=7602 RepID=UPI003AB344FE